jgi:WD40 repeat protein
VETLTCLSTLEGHDDGINSILMLDDTKLVSASSDRTVKVSELQLVAFGIVNGRLTRILIDLEHRNTAIVKYYRGTFKRGA